MFTDGDLKRLKELASRPLEEDCIGYTTLQLPELIARLEAAENYLADCPPCSCGQECDLHSNIREAWKKAAGK